MDGELIWPGRTFPLGATPDAEGTNFAVYARHAEAVDLCLFDPADPNREVRRVRMPDKTGHVFHAYLPGVGPGALYGYRAYGPYEPEAGLRFNASKLLVDPYARAISGEARFSGPIYAYRPGAPEGDLARDDEDSAPAMPRSVVVDDGAFDWGGDRRPCTPWHRSVVYEVHVKGFTMRHPDVPPELRGTYRGFASPPANDHLTRLGVTAVELLPVHEYMDDEFLQEKGLSNYWGYSTLGFFAPEQKYARGSRGEQVREFKELVKALHRAGIEVILDVVYNHTAEGNGDGPTLCFRGLANEIYYILDKDLTQYANYSGTGNTLNANQPIVRRMIVDSLRYWVAEMHVDGFRFDLASILARDESGRPLENPPVLWDIESDPVLAGTKLIAEAWDAAGLYQVGTFVGDSWKEWNGRFRDDVRGFVKADRGTVRRLAQRILGSPDIFGHQEREPEQSINFVTCHDGFTLNDLVSYNDKHNEANGEGNRDGSDNNLSWNCGVEGPAEDAEVDRLRRRQIKNFIVTLLISVGTPMLQMGDEMRRSQRGNNNAYCQDNETSWLDWGLLARSRDLFLFVRTLIAQRLRWVEESGVASFELSLNELLRSAEFDWHGVRLGSPDWADNSHSIALTIRSGRGRLPFWLHVMFNAYWEALDFDLPPPPATAIDGWRRWIDTSRESPEDIMDVSTAPEVPETRYHAAPRSVTALFLRIDPSYGSSQPAPVRL